jgi:hypothetical protein
MSALIRLRPYCCVAVDPPLGADNPHYAAQQKGSDHLLGARE